MKPYGQKHASRVCECVQCGKQKKGAFSKRARRKAKEEIELLISPIDGEVRVVMTKEQFKTLRKRINDNRR